VTNLKSLSEDYCQAFIGLINRQTGLEIKEREQASLVEKILTRMNAVKLLSPEKYYQLLESNTIESLQEWKKLVVLITNTDSYFFRDQGQFDILRNHILPEIIQKKQSHKTKTIRICSAGCASGEEPYSVAILLQEIIPKIEEWNLMIFGLDINQAALKKAEAGIYTAWSFRNSQQKLIHRYFLPARDQYFLDRRIKEMVKFVNLNLIKDPLPQSNSQLRDMDLIICRNVFIYFEVCAIAKVLDKFYHSLQPLGYLLTGHTELSGQNLSRFQTKVFPDSLIYQKL
jgi:chemotaxis protein methyltransferase CheR